MTKSEQVFKRKAVLGVLLLIVKRVLIQVIFTGSNIFLARLLFPDDFGTFAIVGSVSAIFNVFADFGLSPALIQKKEDLHKNDIRTAFSLQLLLCSILVLVIFVAAAPVSKFFGLGLVGISLLKLYSLKFIIDPFRLVPSAILERHLDYKKIVTLDLLTTLIGSGSSVFLAFLGFGVYSFVYGLLIGHLSSALLLFAVLKWPIGIKVDRAVFSRLARFGVPYQAQMILGLFFGPLILLYLGKTVGQTNLGFYQFAASLSVLPIAFSEILNRVIFPLGSRTQSDKAFLSQAVERSLSLVSMTTLPAIFIVSAIAGQIIHYVYTDKWLAVLPALYLGLLQMGVVAYTGSFSQFLLARGQAKVIRNMSVVWALLTWILAPFLIAKFNFVGMNMTSLIVSLSGIWLYFRLKKEISFNFGKNFSVYFLAAIAGSAVVLGIVNILPESLASLVFSLIIGGVSYVILLVLFAKQQLTEILQLGASMVFRQKP